MAKSNSTQKPSASGKKKPDAIPILPFPQWLERALVSGAKIVVRAIIGRLLMRGCKDENNV